MHHRLSGVLLLVLVSLLAFSQPVLGQDAFRASLTAPDIQSFPKITTYLDIRGEQDQFIHGLQAKDIQILENGSPAPVESLRELRPGVQLVVALNPGPTFAVRNNQGQSRLEFVLEGLVRWANQRQGTTIDDLSLVAPGGLEITHLTDLASWSTALQNTQINAKELEPSLAPLVRALEIAGGGETSALGQGRAILFVTAPPERQASLQVENLASQAAGLGVKVTVWMVTPTGAPLNEGGQSLVELAAQTGGQFFEISEVDDVPDPEIFLEPLRSVYELVYSSQIRSGGQHQITAEISTGGLQVQSSPLAFSLDLQPPQPVFVSPPLDVRREPLVKEVAAEELQDGQVEYAPGAQELEVLVSFPDQNPRPLSAVRLYVDGELVAENTAPPFNHFTWNLAPYDRDGEHLLQVEAIDQLGMAGKSIETLVSVSVEQPELSPIASLQRHTPLLAALGLVVAASVVVLVLVFQGRIHPYSFLRRPARSRQVSSEEQPAPTPKPESSTHRLTNWMTRFQWPHRRPVSHSLAFLTPLENGAEYQIIPPIPLSREEITIGSDSEKAFLVIPDPTIQDCHARLAYTPEGSFHLEDAGSIAGTWINYAPVPPGGAALQHNDLIHFGKVGFRFTLEKPAMILTPIVLPIEEKELHA